MGLMIFFSNSCPLYCHIAAFGQLSSGRMKK